MPRRLLALVAAIAMVAGALFIRSRLDQREEDKANPPSLACVAELAAFCQRIAEESDVNVTVEPAGQTVDRAVALGGAGNIDGWLTAAPWPTMLDQRRQARALPALFATPTPPPIARSNIVLAVWPDRADALRPNCGNQSASWKCLGAVAGKNTWKDVPGGKETWGPVKISLNDPQQHALGAVAFTAAAVEYFGRSDLATIDFEDDAFRDWVSDLKSATPVIPTADFASVLARGESVTDVYVGLEADVRPAVDASRRQPKPVVLYPSAVVTFDLTLAVAPGRAGERLTEIVGELAEEHLADMGWQVPGSASPSSTFDPGVVDALRQVWKEAAG